MKVILNLENYTVEYLDTTPFIQGTDSRNKIEVLVPQETISNIMISYTLASGRSTIAVANNSLTTETYNNVTYDKAKFTLPSTITRLEGNIMATLVVTISGAKHKFNILNTILNSSDFETFEDALEGTAAVVASSLEAMNEDITELGTDYNAHKTNKNNPHEVTKAQVGLGNCDNTSDKDKPISDATQNALDQLDQRIDDLGAIAEMPDKIIDVANCFDFTNDESSVDLDNATIDNVNADNVNADNVNADEVKTPKIGSSKNSNKNTIEFGNGYGLNYITFKTTDGTYTNTLTLQDLVNMAQGKTSNYVIDDTVTGTHIVNSSFNSSNASIVINISANEESYNRIKDVNNKSIYFDDLKIGDIVSVTQNDVPDRWVGAITSTTVTFYALESKLNIDSTPTQNSVNPISSGGVYNALLGKVDKTQIGYFAITASQTSITNQDDEYSAGSDYDEIRAEFRKPYCIIREVHYEDITGYHDNDVYYIKYKTDLYTNNENQYYHYFVAFGNKNNNTDVDKIQYLKVSDFSNGAGFPIAFARYSVDLEAKSNKTTSISSSSTDTQYPSAKAVYDFTQPKVDKLNYNLGAFDSVSGGTITRQTGYLVLNKNNANWGLTGNGRVYYSEIIINNANKPANDDTLANIVCNKLTTVSYNALYDGDVSSGIAINSSGYLGISASDYANLTEIVIQYELSSSYTEQVIENEPILNLDQNGCNFVRNEWEKTINLFPSNETYTFIGDIYITNADLDLSKYVGETLVFSTTTTPPSAFVAVIEHSDSTTNNYSMGDPFVVQAGDRFDRFYSGASFTAKIMLNIGDHAYPYQAYNGKVIHQKDITPVLLWENASPNSAFADNTSSPISIANIQDYKEVELHAIHYHSNSVYGEQIYKFKVQSYGEYLYTSGTNYRKMIINGTSLSFDGGNDTGNCIPVAIYGLNY